MDWALTLIMFYSLNIYGKNKHFANRKLKDVFYLMNLLWNMKAIGRWIGKTEKENNVILLLEILFVNGTMMKWLMVKLKLKDLEIQTIRVSELKKDGSSRILLTTPALSNFIKFNKCFI